MKRAAETELSSEVLKRVALGKRLKGVSKGEFKTMERVVARAMEPHSDQPIVLDVRERNEKDGEDYTLMLYPENHANALYLLQKLHATTNSAHNKLTLALYDIDIGGDNGWRDYLAEETEDEKKEEEEAAEEENEKNDDDNSDCEGEEDDDEAEKKARECDDARRKKKREQQAVARHAWQDEQLRQCGVPPVGRIQELDYCTDCEGNATLSPWLYHQDCYYGLSSDSDDDDDAC